MKLQEKKEFLLQTGYYSVLGVMLYFALRFALSYLMPFIIATLISRAVQNRAEGLSERAGIKKEYCAVIIVFLIYFGVAVLIYLLSKTVFSYSDSMLEGLGDYLLKGYKTIKGINLPISKRTRFYDTIKNSLDSLVSRIFISLSKAATDFAKVIPSIFVFLIVTVVSSFYIAKDYDRLKAFVKGIIPERVSKKLSEIKEITADKTAGIVKGYFILFLLTFAELFIGFLIIGVRPSFLTALAVSLVDVLPVLGTGTVLLPWSLILFLSGNPKRGIALLILYLIITVAKNFEEPQIIGKKVGINPLFTLIAVFVGLKTGGIIGMAVVPLGFIVIIEYYKKQIKEEQT